MSTAEIIFEKAKHLPENLQNEALHYMDFLLTQRVVEMDDARWSAFSMAQLARQYVEADAIYDQD